MLAPRFAAPIILFSLARLGAAQQFRPPAVPLITFDPYLSIWSENDRLNDDDTHHWTGREHALRCLIRVDGHLFDLMGANPANSTPMPQLSLKVMPTRTLYAFSGGGVHVDLTFRTAALPDDLDVLSRPLGTIEWSVRSTDGVRHNVTLVQTASSQLCVNEPKQRVDWTRYSVGGMTALRMGSADQPILRLAGDDTRIDWGYAYLASAQATSAQVGSEDDVLGSFAARGSLTGHDDARQPRAVEDEQPVMGLAFDFGRVGTSAISRHAMVAYDEIYAIDYFGKRLRPYWRRNGATALDLLQASERDFAAVQRRCEAFDAEMMADLATVGGAKYAEIGALAYRQFLAATGLAADDRKQPLLFTKENTSNGDIATVDVIFPMAPALVLLSPTLAKASIVPILSYAASSHWKFPNAPHDLGTYPLALGTDDGGEGMPVEESGNMLILCDAICQEEGSGSFVDPWWPQLTQWATYLEKYGLDPEDQLCTDDFMGHLAHNSNLSIKAILGLAAYGDMARIRGDAATADRYAKLAKVDAVHWVEIADAGDHSLLAFDKPGTWSQKYNLVWDRILGLNVFPPSVAEREVAYYKSVLQPFGVPLDSRTHLTKTDWSSWSATLASNRADFEAIVDPIWNYLNTTTSRVPLVDSYVTDDIHSDGMHARPVVGGLFIKMLADPAMWKKWSHRDRAKVGPWAPLPKPPTTIEVVPTSQKNGQSWRYTFVKPTILWTANAFDDSAWKSGLGPFGSPGTPGIAPNTAWTSDDIWLRRVATLPAGPFHDLQFLAFHDEDIEIYVNGVLASSAPGYVTSYQLLEIGSQALRLLKPGATVTIAVHCHQTTGGQGIDVGLVDVVPRP